MKLKVALLFLLMILPLAVYLDQGNSNGNVNESFQIRYSGRTTTSDAIPFSNNYGNISEFADGITSIEFSPDGTLFATGSRDGCVRLFDAISGEFLKVFRRHFVLGGGASLAVAFNNQGTLLASGGTGNIVNLWNVTSRQFKTALLQNSTVSAIDFSPADEPVLAVGSDRVRIWNTSTGEVLQEFIGFGTGVQSLTFSYDGKMLATGDVLGTVKIWNISTGLEIHGIPGHSGTVSSVSFSPDDSVLATASSDKTVKLWDTASGTLVRTLIGHEYEVKVVKFSPAAHLLASSDGAETKGSPAIKIWNSTTGDLLNTLKAHKNAIESISFSPDGSKLASASLDKSIKLWGDYPPFAREPIIDDFPVATPEDKGLNSTVLDIIDDQIQAGGLVHSFLVVRDGSLVYEKYYSDDYYDYAINSKHKLHSCTKSITSALTGIAIREGYIGINDHILDYFPELTILNRNSWKEAITIEHLLTMTSGLNCTTSNTNPAFTNSTDSIQYFLDLPMIAEPGTRFIYNSGGPHILSAIIQKATGLSIRNFALNYLFKPMGIDSDDVIWMEDSQGRSYGGSGLYLTPRNMAKFGLLYLQHGAWNGTQIISEEWVNASTAVAVTEERTERDRGYGYLWWTWTHGTVNGYSASGGGGQQIYIFPEQDLVVVFTAGGSELWRPDQYAYSVLDAIMPSQASASSSSTTTVSITSGFSIIESGLIIVAMVAVKGTGKLEKRKKK